MINKIVEELKKSGHEISEEVVKVVLEHASNIIEIPETSESESVKEDSNYTTMLDLASGVYEISVTSDNLGESIVVKSIDIHPNYCGTAIIEMHNGVTFQCNACHQVAEDGSVSISAELPIVAEGISSNKDFNIKIG